jgi:hypothetical protein
MKSVRSAAPRPHHALANEDRSEDRGGPYGSRESCRPGSPFRRRDRLSGLRPPRRRLRLRPHQWRGVEAPFEQQELQPLVLRRPTAPPLKADPSGGDRTRPTILYVTQRPSPRAARPSHPSEPPERARTR